MKIKLSVRRIGGQTTDLLVTADASTTVGDLARVIRASDDAIGGDAGALGGLRLAADDGDAPILLDESALLTESPLASGAIVDFGGTAPTRPPRARGGVSLFVLEGPDAGKTFELATTHGTVGRQAGSTVALSDPRVSKHHADFDVIEGRLRIEDQNSANGIHVGARRLTRVDLADGEIVALADTVLQVRIDQSTGTPAVPVAGSVPFTRSPRVQPRYRGASLVAPSLPEEIDPPMFPWVALLAPVALGAVFLATGRSIESVLFFAASPLILGATFLSSRWLRRRREKRMRERFETRIARLEETLESERRREQEIRRAEAPATHDVIADALRLGPLLWSRRPEHWQFLMINLGSASLPSRTSVRIPDEETARQEVLDRVGALTSTFRDVAAVPVLESLPLAGSLGVVGPRAEAGALARGYLLQFAGLHSPAELVLTAVIGSSVWQSELDWIKWLPHVGSPYSPLRVDGLASGRDEADRVLAGIEELIVERGGTRSARGPLPDDAAAIHTGAEAGESVFGGPPSPLPAVVLVVSTDAPADRARLVQIAENGPEAGVFTIWLGEDPGEIPATARTFVRVDGGGSAQIGFVRQGTRVSDVRIEPVERATALEVARRLSPVVDIGALVLDESDLPAEIGLLDLLDPRATLTASQIGERWTENEAPLADGRRRDAGGLQARVGSTGRGPYALDIRRDGPHALVGGTSGSGKSEFLQSWVLSMAVERSPERLAFLFVDYKGGAAFQVFDRERLPHRAGIVTDLEGHLARRVLRYLGAEIERRERLFREKGVSGLAALEELGDPEAPPALVVIVDEYATVVDNIPDFEAGMVDIAQRGRALGIHLILATQQPSSVIKGALRANTNLRVALRVADAEDSVNVVGDRIAAGFDPALRGRAAVSTGPGRLDVFQTAYVGGTRAGGASPILLSEFGFAVDRRWRPTPAPAVESTDESAPSSDAVQLIALLKQAAAENGIAEFRASWLDPLPSVIALDDLDDPSAVVRDARLPFGAIDIPGEPERGVLAFEPDRDQNLAIFGAGGSGKSSALRSIAVSAARADVDVYAIDCASGALGMIEPLPAVGAVVAGHDAPRVHRLLRLLRETLDDRRERYGTSTIDEIRARRKGADEPRKLLLIDGYDAFTKIYDTARPGSAHAVLHSLMHAGRAFGIHVVLTVDQPNGLRAVGTTVQKTVVLRQSDQDVYSLLRVPKDLVSPESPPGRGIVAGLEVQIAVPGGSADTIAQSDAIDGIAGELAKRGRRRPPAVGVLPETVAVSELSARADGRPVLGLDDDTLASRAFTPRGIIAVAGPPGAGAPVVQVIAEAALAAADVVPRRVFLSRSAWTPEWLDGWDQVATTEQAIRDVVTELAVGLAPGTAPADRPLLLVVEGLAGIGAPSSEIERTLRGVLDGVARSADGLAIVEESTRQWSRFGAITEDVRWKASLAVVLSSSPEDVAYFGVAPPAGQAAAFPPGRAFLVEDRRVSLVQVAVPDPAPAG